jgi:nucleoside-triphosphatase THEP1
MSFDMASIAAVLSDDSEPVQSLFTTMTGRWRASGMKVVGLLGESHGIPDRKCGAGVVRDIVSGRPFAMYFDTPPKGGSCHLDPAGLEAASTQLLDQIATSDLVILSKFGKLETMRAGLIGAFEAAAEAGVPVLTSVSEKHRAAWESFAPGAAYLAPDAAALEGWRRGLKGRRIPDSPPINPLAP